MKKWAIVQNNIVTNTVVWDGSNSWTPPEDAVMIDITDMINAPGPGYSYQDGVFTPPPPPEPQKEPVPASITRRQCSLELLNREMITDVEALNMTRSGIPPSAVMTYIESLSTEQQIRAEIDFAADNYYRENELLIMMMTANGWNSDDIDDFFIEASKL